MAESHQKRAREEYETPDPTDSKRQNSLTESTDDSLEPISKLELSAAVFPQELSAFDFDILLVEEEEKEQIHRDASAACSSSDEDDGGVNSVMRHLLEASDDELGIPNQGAEENSCAENLPYDFGNEGLWEFEDVAAGYYSYIMLTPEPFMY